MLLLLGWNHFFVEKMLDFDVFNECVTDQPTDRPTDRPTDTAYYRDARTHLKSRNRKGEKEAQKGKMLRLCVCAKSEDGARATFNPRVRKKETRRTTTHKITRDTREITIC